MGRDRLLDGTQGIDQVYPLAAVEICSAKGGFTDDPLLKEEGAPGTGQ
jgi:hypothetical protein